MSTLELLEDLKRKLLLDTERIFEDLAILIAEYFAQHELYVFQNFLQELELIKKSNNNCIAKIEEEMQIYINRLLFLLDASSRDNFESIKRRQSKNSIFDFLSSRENLKRLNKGISA